MRHDERGVPMSTPYNKLSPEAKERYLQAMRNPKLHPTRVCRGSYGIVEAPRAKVDLCQTCYDQSWRRPRFAPCDECHGTYAEEPLPRAVARIGSAADMCVEMRGAR